MALIVEDGTGKLDAESYQSVAGLQAYAAKFGLTVPADVTACEILLRKATRYMVQTCRGSWQGMRTVYNEALDWPRYDVYRDPYDLIASNVIPPEVLDACSQLAVVGQTQELMPTAMTRGKKRVKIGPLEIEYDGEAAQATAFVNAMALLEPLLTPTANGLYADVVRS